MKQGQQYTCDECGVTVESVEQDLPPSGWTFWLSDKNEWLDLCRECRKKYGL